MTDANGCYSCWWVYCYLPLLSLIHNVSMLVKLLKQKFWCQCLFKLSGSSPSDCFISNVKEFLFTFVDSSSLCYQRFFKVIFMWVMMLWEPRCYCSNGFIFSCLVAILYENVENSSSVKGRVRHDKDGNCLMLKSFLFVEKWSALWDESFQIFFTKKHNNNVEVEIKSFLNEWT